MIFPYFLLNFTNKEENISTNFFKIESFIYKPNSISNFQPILTIDNFKTSKEYHEYLFENDIHDIEERYVQESHSFRNPLGNFLFDFLNANSIDKIFIKKLLFKYGIATLTDPVGKSFSEDFNLFYEDPRASKNDDSIDIDYFQSKMSAGIKDIMNSYIVLQKALKDVINFSYNINEEKYLNGLTPTQRYYIYVHSYKEDSYMELFKYLTDVSFSQEFDFSEYDKSIKKSSFNSPEGLAKYIKNECKKNQNFLIKNYMYSFSSL